MYTKKPPACSAERFGHKNSALKYFLSIVIGIFSQISRFMENLDKCKNDEKWGVLNSRHIYY